jgi:nucleotide-binding universal stress UspA family protein
MDDWIIKSIVLGYDDSEGSERAARLAAAIARRNRARVYVVHAFEAPRLDLDALRLGRIVGTAQDVGTQGVRELEEAGVEAEPEVLEGAPGDTILKVAAIRGADLIIVGRGGHGLLGDLLLGSTSEHVVRGAKIPVLVAH